jgi:DNA-binding NarL/FixJ family response regulator
MITAREKSIMRARILVADDHVGMLQRISELLHSRFEVVGVVNDGLAAVDATVRLRPDLVVLDIIMPEMDGIQAAQELKRQGCEVKIVFLTVQQDEEYVAAAFKSGAIAYVLKSRMHSDLVPAIDRALAGEIFVSPGSEHGTRG